jgi:flagellin-like hook-associated protein FlgL
MSRIGDLYQQNKIIQDTILAKKRLEAISLKKIQKPSDNPFDAARVVINHDALINIDQYKKNIDLVKPTLEFASHVMDDIFEDILSRARYNAIRADGIKLNTEAHAIATEVSLLKEKLLNYVNSTFYGSYVFAGTKVYDQPFTFTYSELKSYNSFGNIYNTEVLSHNALASTDSIALQAGDTLTFSIGDRNIYIKALNDMTLEDVVNRINAIAAQGNIPVVATAINTEDGYKLFIRSGIPSLPPSQIDFGETLGTPQKEYQDTDGNIQSDYPQLVLPEGKTLTIEVKNIQEDTSYFVTFTADKDMGLADVKAKLDELFKEEGLNASAVIRKTSDGKNYLSLITGDPNLRFVNIVDEGGKIAPEDVEPSSLIINNSSGKIVYLGDYTEREVFVDDKKTVKANVVIADEVAKIWNTLSILESAILSKAEPFAVTEDSAQLDDIVLSEGDTFSFEFDGNTIQIEADTDMTLETLVNKINEKVTTMGLEVKAEIQPVWDDEFALKISSKDPAKTVTNVKVTGIDSSGNTIDKTNDFMGGINYTTSASDFISYAIKSIDEIMVSFNKVREKTGANLEFIEYTQDKLMEKEVTISEETDKLENAKLEETLAQMSQYDAMYQMNLLLLSKMSKVSLLDYMR